MRHIHITDHERSAARPARRGHAFVAVWRILVVAILPMIAIAQTTPPDLTQATLDELMNIPVTSVSKKEQSLSKTGSAVYVITQDDIRRSGATNIPDLLRMVPGVDVARINQNAWAISIRGFNYRYSSKVLVLIDGRTVYTPGFSGVYWDQQFVPLENIDRIEVIRGPGGTVWGANAMNGVINIITKTADETRGGLISAVAGSQDLAQGLAQYGGDAGSAGSYRVYAHYGMNESSPSIPGSPADDAGHNLQTGFRSDWDLSSSDKLTVQGDLFGESAIQTITTTFADRVPPSYALTTFDDAVRVGSGNLLGRWTHKFSNGSEATLQTYYDRFSRFDQALNIVDTGDADFQYHFHIGPRNDIVAGIGYRLTDQTYTDGYEITFGTGRRRDNLFSTFIQDEIDLTDSLALTMGTKVEHNAFTGFELEPSVRLVWSPDARQSVWAAVSRAVQQPSWLDEQSQLTVETVPVPGVGSGLVQLNGNLNLEAPTVLDYELGYRTEVTKRLTLDASVFLAYYSSLLTDESQAPYFIVTPEPFLVIPTTYGNYGKAKDYGVEFSAHWNATAWWRVSPGFSFLQSDLSLNPASNDTSFGANNTGDSPKNQAQLRSQINLPSHLEWDTSVFYVGHLKGGAGVGLVPAYTRLDVRLGRKLGESTEISIAGQNLLTPRHIEFLDGLQVIPSETARSIVARVTWRFGGPS